MLGLALPVTRHLTDLLWLAGCCLLLCSCFPFCGVTHGRFFYTVLSLLLHGAFPLMQHECCRLFEFQRHYELQVAPLLIQADAQITRINEMSSVDWQDEEITLSLLRQKQALTLGV